MGHLQAAANRLCDSAAPAPNDGMETSMVDRVVEVVGDEILDSRGHPTLRVEVKLESGLSAFASVPSGASTGEGEAHELRDGDPKRYGGRGVLKAIANLAEISLVIRGQDPTDQAQIDRMLIEADGTEAKSRLGANAIVGTSMAVARAGAQVSRRPLYAYLAADVSYRLPVPMMNVINGGRHATNSLDFQEFMIVPHGAPSFREALRWGAETYHALRAILSENGLGVGVGDEGGFAPNLEGNEAACSLIVEAIDRAGFIPGEQIALALDPAASSFWDNGSYNLTKSGGGPMNSAALQALYADWARRFPIVSIEDGFGEHDWNGFRAQSAELGRSIQIVGDDLYVTNPKLIERGISEHATNAVLIKLNQIGTVTETITAISTCRSAGWNYIISHRSGETDDSFIADFAVAMNGGQIKAGAPCRSERLAKYNRLLEIEREIAGQSFYISPFKHAQPSTSERPALRSGQSTQEVVAVIEEADTARRCLIVAQRAAQLANSMPLSALHICVDPSRLIAAAEEIDLQKMREFKEHTAQERLQRARQVFEAWVAFSGAQVRWLEHVGDITSSLLAEVGNAALIAIAHPHNLDSADALHAAIFNAHRPVLFVPTEGGLPATLGDHIVIAWKPRTQARKAIMRTLPWLRAAKKITIVAVDEPDTTQDCSEVLGLLQEHGITAEARHVRTERGQHIGSRLLAEANAVSADSIVMGAFRFGQIFEWVFGGVTHEVLNRTRLPVFMMH
jgi:enolase